MRLACQEQLIPGDTLEQKWSFISEAGFDGIELLGHGDGAFAHRLLELRRAREAGVVLSSVCVAMDHFISDVDEEQRRDAVEQMKTLLSVIGEVGGAGAITPAAFGKWSRVLPPWDPPPRSPEEDRQVLAEALRELAEHARSEGTTVLFEPLNRYEDHMVNRLDQAAVICRGVDSPALRVMADTFHMNIEEDDVPTAIRSNADMIGHVHVADSGRLQPGVGHLEWPAVMGALGAVGYEGWLAMECGIRGDPSTELPKVAELVRSLM